MGKNLQKLYSFRCDDELIDKIEVIAKENTRTRNKEIEHVLKLYVKDYESKHGKITRSSEKVILVADRKI